MLIQNKFINFKNVKLITIENQTGLKITLCSFGAAIKSIYVDEDLLTYQSDNLKQFMFSSSYNGKTVGRTCGRIKDGIFNIGDIEYHAKKRGKNALHGGIKSFSFRNFKYDLYEDDETYTINFFRDSLDGEEGYPGLLKVNVTYTIYKKENKIDIDILAKSNKDTIVNITNHTYWSLGDNDVSKDLLEIDSKEYVNVDKELLFDSIKDVDDKFDFRKPHQLNDYFDEVEKTFTKGYDTDYLLDKRNEYDAMLQGQKYSLKITTTYPILHVYVIRPFKGIAFECEKKAFDIPSLVLEKNKIYEEKITYTIERRK
jgi:aldose 1-epimerase